MTVTVALFGPYRDVSDEKYIELELATPTTVRSVLRALGEAVPALEDEFEPMDENVAIVITVDGTHTQQLDGLETTVESGAVVRLTPPITGGNDSTPLYQSGGDRWI